MLLRSIAIIAGIVTYHSWGAELRFDFGQYPLNETPPGFRSAVSGDGQPGVWKIVEDDVPPALTPLSPKSPVATKKHVLAQLSGDLTDEHFPILIYEKEAFGDFTLTTRFKNVGGAIEQMAGIAFRIQDERNYYYVRASSLGNSFRFFKIVNGVRSAPIGPEVSIPKGVWHDLSIECEGNRIRCLLDGKELFPTLTDNSFSAGKIGFWTKSDSIAYFVDTKLVYTPRETLARLIVREMLEDYPRLLGLKVYTIVEGSAQPAIAASSDEKELGKTGDKVERDVIEHNTVYFGKSDNSVSVTLPLHDRNGDTVAAVRVVMKSFPGQTEQNAVARALPIVKKMEARVRLAKDAFR